MNSPNCIAASEAKAKLSELLDRVRNGESFLITLHGEEAAKLVPARGPSREDVAAVIAEMKTARSLLNPVGKRKLTVKDMINVGRR